MNKAEGLKINLGSGNKAYEGFVNVDKIKLPGVNLIWDLEKTPLPFKTNSVQEIICEHILEHVTNYMPLLEEMHRICRPGAKIIISAPYYKYEGAYRDPTHVRFFTEHSFDYFKEGMPYDFYSKARFEVKKVYLRNHFFSGVKNIHKKIIPFIPFKSVLKMFFWNIYSEINYELKVVK